MAQMKFSLPLLLLLATACRPNVIISVKADSSATDDGLKNSDKFDVTLFLYSQADEGVVTETATLSVGGQARFKMNPGTLDLHAISIDSVNPPEGCDEECTGYWEGLEENLVVPAKGHIDESVTVFAVCEC